MDTWNSIDASDRAWLMNALQATLERHGPLPLSPLVERVTALLHGPEGYLASRGFLDLWAQPIHRLALCKAGLAQLGAQQAIALPGQIARGIRSIGSWVVFTRNALVQGHADIAGLLVNMRVGESVFIDLDVHKRVTIRSIVQRVQARTSLKLTTRHYKHLNALKIRVTADTALGVKAT